MKILILGAGQVGGTLAENLANEANDITVVDSNSTRLRELQDRLDIRTVQGRASYPTILRQAGAEDADMLIAVTSSDEVNMVACQIASVMFKTPTKISRVRANAYLARKELFGENGFPIDVLISPEHLVTKHITRLIEYPGALQVLEFSKAWCDWSQSGPSRAGHWWAMNFPICAPICRESIPAWPPYSAKTGPFRPRATPLSKTATKSFSLPVPTISVRS